MKDVTNRVYIELRYGTGRKKRKSLRTSYPRRAHREEERQRKKPGKKPGKTPWGQGGRTVRKKRKAKKKKKGQSKTRYISRFKLSCRFSPIWISIHKNNPGASTRPFHWAGCRSGLCNIAPQKRTVPVQSVPHHMTAKTLGWPDTHQVSPMIVAYKHPGY